MKIFFDNKTSGQSMIELLITIGISAIIIPAVVFGFISARQGKAQLKQRSEAIELLKEAQESVRVVREKGWTSIAQNGIYHPVVSSNSWSLSSGAEIINGFTRSIVISNTFRNASGQIVSSGGIQDPSTKKLDITVSWNTPFLSSVSSSTYLTRFTNSVFTQTLVADFNAGSGTGTTVTNSSGGEVVLSAGGMGSDWCEPNLSITAIDLPKNGVANAVAAIEGKVFAGTGENASGVSYASVNISNTDPPAGIIDATFNGFKTNDVFGEQNYAYLATDNNFKEVEIINIATVPYAEAGFFNAPGNGSSDSVFVSGNVGYAISGNILYSFDLSNKSGSRPLLGSVALAGTGRKIFAVGEYVYVAETGTTQLQIVQVSNNGATLTVVGQASLPAQGAQDLFVTSSADRVYVATSVSDVQREMFIVDTTTKSGDRPVLGSYEANGMNPKGITKVTNNKVILVGFGAEEYQVIDVANENAPAKCGGLSIDNGVNGVASVIESDGDAFSYIITGDSTSELKIIKGGPGGQYSSSGIFTSSIFDPGFEISVNRLFVNFNQPTQTSIKFQVAIQDPVDNSCDNAVFSYVGPDGTQDTYFTGDSPVPTSDDGINFENPGRCLRYKVFLSSSDLTQTPVLFDISFNYSL